MSSSDLQVFRLSNVTIKDATISKTMTVRFTITLNETLGDNPKLQLVLRKKNGLKIPCFLGYGSWYGSLSSIQFDLEKLNAKKNAY